MVLESVARIVKVQLPAYLKRLPVPESITGFARLTGGVYRCIYFHNSSNLLNKLNYKLCLNEKEIKQITLFRGCSGDQFQNGSGCCHSLVYSHYLATLQFDHFSRRKNNRRTA
nr:CDGSH iron-sulfur domain-containing protein 2 isoform X2 [Oryctolagus cuniculus]